MVIGIDASRAFLKRRTGIEEYAYQTIKHLRKELPPHTEVVLYVRKKLSFHHGRVQMTVPEIDFELPQHWRVRGMWAPRFWTQIALSVEMLLHAPTVLFVPAHTVPMIHPKNTVVTIHGLEYEFFPEAYSFWERLYMRMSIRYSCRVAKRVICVSENTKKDVMKLYGVPEEKIQVIYEGYANQRTDNNQQTTITQEKPYLLFIGRLEERKNIVRILGAFEILKEHYQIPHELMLVGKPGYGYERIQTKIRNSKFKNHIKEQGYVTEEEKWQLLKRADVFLFPTLYEGFGIPILEAQSVGVPVVTSNTSSLPEVAGPPTMPPSDIVLRAGGGALFVDPESVESIVEGIHQVLSNPVLRSGIIERAAHNVNRFGWASCARKVARLLRRQNHLSALR